MLQSIKDILNVDPTLYKDEIMASARNRVEVMTEYVIDSFDTIFYLGSYAGALKNLAAKIIAVGGHVIGFKFPENAVAAGAGSIAKLGGFCRKNNWKKPLIVTDKSLVKIGLVQKAIDSLTAAGLSYAIYDGTVPDPTVENVEEAYRVYVDEGCDLVIGFGGGSPIDAAKAVAGRVARPARTANHMGGVFGVTLPSLTWLLKKPANYPKTICIPTTSGTGAEITFSSVISNRRTGRKYTINDFSVQPDYSILDPELTYGVPAEMTAYTGIDALSHLTEAYVGHGHSKKSDDMSREGIQLVFENLDKAVAEPNNAEARANMMKAAHLGGRVLISGYTTYVHPFAHKVGALTHLTHGYLIGSFMPPVLEYYRPEADGRLAELAELIGVAAPGMSVEQKAEAYIQAIRDLCTRHGIDGLVPQIVTLDYKDIIKSIRTESFAYPVPKLMSNADIKAILDEVAGK